MLRLRALSRLCSSLSPHLVTPLWLGVMGVAVALSGCGGNDAGAVEAIPEDEVVPRPTPIPAAREALLDADGKLLPSERVLAGLTLPRGLESEQSGNNRHLFEAPVPALKLVEYFGPRLLTGQVEPNGTGASFINAIALRPSGTAYHMDVIITERGSHRSSLIIRLTDAPTARPSTPTPEDLAEYHERLD
jgi:hypothetical protein